MNISDNKVIVLGSILGISGLLTLYLTFKNSSKNKIIQSLEQEVIELKKQKDIFQKEKKQEIENLIHQQNVELENVLKSKATEQTMIQQEMIRLRKRETELENENTSQKEEILNLENNLTNLKNQFSEMMNKLKNVQQDSLQKLRNEKEKEINNLLEENKKLKEELQKLQ
ncbi:hypothetical protein ABK040_012939 [Willaertia magna]